jgi:hypothetical protein
VIAADAAEPVRRDAHRRSPRIDATSREWVRRREDPERLRALHTAVVEELVTLAADH